MNECDHSGACRQCPNCGVTLTGRYCSACGQEDHSLAIPLYRLALDFLSDHFQFDAHIWHTLGLLLFRPGLLTRNYLAGQRQSYIPPIRLYLFAAIVFFLAAGFLPLKPIPVVIGGPQELGILAPGAATQLGSAPATAGNQPSASNIDKLIQKRMAISSHTRNPAAASTSRAASSWLTSHIVALKKKPGEFMKRFWNNMPKVLFFLIPVFALLLKLLYLLHKRYYSEHLIFALHYHSALFIYLLVIVLLMLLARVLGPTLTAIVRWFCLALGIWSVIYVSPAMRITYGDTWPRAVWRGLVLWLAYSIALFAGTNIAMTITFVTS